jgi:hypothetical protein
VGESGLKRAFAGLGTWINNFEGSIIGMPLYYIYKIQLIPHRKHTASPLKKLVR